MAMENGIVVQTEEELIAAIENYAESIVIDGYIHLSEAVEVRHHLTLHGQGTMTVSGHHRHFEMWGRSQLVIDGDIILTRAEGYEGLGGGIRNVGGTLIIKSGNIYNNEMERGGGVHITEGRLYIYGGTISQNSASIGGGVYIGGWDVFDVLLFNFRSALFMRGGEISNNVAAFTGGGLYSTIANIYLESGVIANNRASGSGGIFISSISQYYVSSEMQFENNYPVNRHDIELSGFRWYELLESPTIFHIIVAFIIIGIGIFLSKRKRNNSNSVESDQNQQSEEGKPDSEDSGSSPG